MTTAKKPTAPAKITVTITPTDAKHQPVTIELAYVRESERGFRYEIPATCEALPPHHGKGPRANETFTQALYMGKTFLGMKAKAYNEPASHEKNGPVKSSKSKATAKPATATSESSEIAEIKATLNTLMAALKAQATAK
jgi:hypothetical protein